MSKILIGLAVVLAFILFIGGISLLAVIGTHNNLVKSDVNVEQKWGAVQSAYQRRADLIPNLVAVVQQYSDYEGDTLKAVTQARASIGGARTPAELDAAGGQINSALSRLLVVVEQYPNLKANEQYLNLQVQLEGTENRINTERNYYNTAVQDYKTRVRTFPSNIIANIFGFDETKWEMFKADADAQNSPKVAELFHK